MTTPPEPVTSLDPYAAVVERIRATNAPMKLGDAIKGIKPPKKVKKPEFLLQVQNLLDERIAAGEVFCAPSGKNGEARYWSRDEKQELFSKLPEMASQPQTMPKLKSILGKVVPGMSPTFVEECIRDAIGTGRLFAHGTAAKPTYGAAPPLPPEPPLKHKKHQSALATLVKSCHKLLVKAEVEVETLLDELRGQLSQLTTSLAVRPEVQRPEPPTVTPMHEVSPAVATAPTDATTPPVPSPAVDPGESAATSPADPSEPTN